MSHPPLEKETPIPAHPQKRVRQLRPDSYESPDLHSQLEELLSQVWRSEKWAALEDRIDLSLGVIRNR